MTIMKRVSAVVLAGAALAACGHDGSRLALASGPFGLFYDDRGADVALAYGRANSDDVGLMLQCRKGSGVVEVSDVVREAPAPQLVLASGLGRTVLAARVEAGESAAPAILNARTELSAAALQGLRRSGRLQVAYGGLRYGLHARPAERAGVERFFVACQAARPA